MTTSSKTVGQTALLTVQRNVYELRPATPVGVNTAPGSDMDDNWLVRLPGPETGLTMDHTPVPEAGVLAANVMEGPEKHKASSGPAEAISVAFTVQVATVAQSVVVPQEDTQLFLLAWIIFVPGKPANEGMEELATLQVLPPSVEY